MTGPLGRRVPTDWAHVEKYPLQALRGDVPRRVPVVLGINWYSNFDNPVRDKNGVWWIGKGDLGRVRGGHAICARPLGVIDPPAWQVFYDQGVEGACVGFSESRCMSLLNRVRFDAPWLYNAAQLGDEYDDTPPEEGTSVRAGMNVLLKQGHRRVTRAGSQPVDIVYGITAFRWARSWDEVRRALGIPSVALGVPLLNSWGLSYPHSVRLTDEAGARLLHEDGEAAVVTDR
jgi:hypothetical protein